MRRLLVVVLVAVLAAIGLLVVGCGSTTTTAAPTPSTTAAQSTTTAASSGTTSTGASAGTQTGATDEIPIGLLVPYTGELGAYGVPYTNGSKMAVDDVNAAGGVLGRKLVMYTQDDRSAVEEGIKGARTLIGLNRVVAIGGVISDTAVGVYPICRDNKVFLASPTAGTTRLDKGFGDWFFRTCPSDSFDGRVAARVLLEKGYKTISMLYENDQSRTSIAGAMREAFEAGGGKVISQVSFTPRQPTYSAELKKVSASNPQVVWLGSGQESGSVLLKNSKQAGYKWQWMVSSDLCVPEMFGLVGNDIMEGVLTETPSADSSIDYVSAWNDRYQKAFNAEPTGAFQPNSYDHIVIIALAMQKAGVASGEAIAQNYHKVTDENPNAVVVHSYADGLAALEAGKEIKYEGVSGPCVFDADGQTVGSYNSLIGKNGAWVVDKFYPAADFISN